MDYDIVVGEGGASLSRGLHCEIFPAFFLHTWMSAKEGGMVLSVLPSHSRLLITAPSPHPPGKQMNYEMTRWFGLINWVDNVNWPPYGVSKLRFQAPFARTSYSLWRRALEFQPRNSLRWPIYITNSVDKSESSCYTPPPTENHGFVFSPKMYHDGFFSQDLIKTHHNSTEWTNQRSGAYEHPRIVRAIDSFVFTMTSWNMA